MAEKSSAACKEHGGVDRHVGGGAAHVLAGGIIKVRKVDVREEFGSPESICELEVKDFHAVVTMDSHGESLHKDILAKSEEVLAQRR